ncbi:MAG: zf-HC2 domain-containing protein [Planctomycetes bacterium]|nr:zf-HC2 domain-containing protein [Planctomycetota bacterium]
MRTCEEIRGDLSAYLDGELPSASAAEIERHLAGCPGCREELATLRRVAELVRRLPRETAPANLPLRVEASISASAGAARRRAAWAQLAVAATALFAAIWWALHPPVGPETLVRERRELTSASDDARSARPAGRIAGPEKTGESGAVVRGEKAGKDLAEEERPEEGRPLDRLVPEEGPVDPKVDLAVASEPLSRLSEDLADREEGEHRDGIESEPAAERMKESVAREDAAIAARGRFAEEEKRKEESGRAGELAGDRDVKMGRESAGYSVTKGAPEKTERAGAETEVPEAEPSVAPATPAVPAAAAKPPTPAEPAAPLATPEAAEREAIAESERPAPTDKKPAEASTVAEPAAPAGPGGAPAAPSPAGTPATSVPEALGDAPRSEPAPGAAPESRAEERAKETAVTGVPRVGTDASQGLAEGPSDAAAAGASRRAARRGGNRPGTARTPAGGTVAEGTEGETAAALGKGFTEKEELAGALRFRALRASSAPGADEVFIVARSAASEVVERYLRDLSGLEKQKPAEGSAEKSVAGDSVDSESEGRAAGGRGSAPPPRTAQLFALDMTPPAFEKMCAELERTGRIVAVVRTDAAEEAARKLRETREPETAAGETATRRAAAGQAGLALDHPEKAAEDSLSRGSAPERLRVRVIVLPDTSKP